MKNELGIEICCENCWIKYECDFVVKKTCKRNGLNALFKPSLNAYKSRIRELQKQPFTKAELSTIIDALQMAKEEFAFCPEEKAFDEILKKTERIINER